MLIPNFVVSSLGLTNIPLNFVASIALHTTGVVVLLQYIFGHRSQLETSRNDVKTWPPNDDQDSLHQPLTSEADQWRRRSFVNGRDNVTAMTRAPASNIPKVFSTVVTDEARSSVQAGRMSGWSAQRPSMRQIELPDKVFLPRLSMPIADQYGSGGIASRGSIATYSTRSALSRQVKPPYLNQFRQSKQSVASSQGTFERVAPVPMPTSSRIAQVGYGNRSVNPTRNSIKRETTDITSNSLSLRSLPPPKPVGQISTSNTSSLSTIPENRTLRKKKSETTLLWPVTNPGTPKRSVSSFSQIPAQFEKRISTIRPPRVPSARYYI